MRKRLGMELADLSRGKGSQPSGDAADAAFDASGEEIASQLAELESKELAQVERALRRLKQGTYGKCEVCSVKIPVARLNALPFSTLCIKCQREMEVSGSWPDERSGEDWGKVSDSEAPLMDRPDIDLNDLEMDLTK